MITLRKSTKHVVICIQHPGSDTPSPEGMEEEMDSDNEDDEVEPPKVLGDLLESLAGAIFMDSGMDLQAVWDTLGPLFNEKMGN